MNRTTSFCLSAMQRKGILYANMRSVSQFMTPPSDTTVKHENVWHGKSLISGSTVKSRINKAMDSEAHMKIRKDVIFLAEFSKHTSSLGNKFERSDKGGDIVKIKRENITKHTFIVNPRKLLANSSQEFSEIFR